MAITRPVRPKTPESFISGAPDATPAKGGGVRRGTKQQITLTIAPELLAKVEDRYVIMNAGDELVLRFVAPAPPSAGWQRDFVLIGDGWVKDGDYHTTFSRTVQPLPTHDQPDYTTPPGALEDDPVYRRHAQDWQRYHTRYITPQRFHRALLPLP